MKLTKELMESMTPEELEREIIDRASELLAKRTAEANRKLEQRFMNGTGRAKPRGILSLGPKGGRA